MNLKHKLELFDDLWSPKIIENLNDYQIKLAKIQGEFTWHDHKDTDELFYVVEGEMAILLENETIALKTGDLYVVKKGILHKPVAKDACHIMLIEPKGVINTGDEKSDLTADNDIWI